MKKRSIIATLIVVTISIAIFVGFTILKNNGSRHLIQNSSKTDINMDQPAFDDLEKEKSDSEESNIQDDNKDIISNPVKEQESQSNSVSIKSTNEKTNMNTNSNEASNSNKSTSISKNTNSNKANSNISSTNVTSSNSNKSSTTNTTTNTTTNKQDEWNNFISSTDTLKILGGHLDFYNESDAKAKQKELKGYGYIVNLKYACLEDRCVYSVIAQTGNGLCNANNTEYDWRKLNKMGVIDFLHFLGNDCSGYTDPFSGESY